MTHQPTDRETSVLVTVTIVMALAMAAVESLSTARADDTPPTQEQAIENLEQLLVEYDEGTLNAHHAQQQGPTANVEADAINPASLVSLRAEITALRAENEALREQNEELRVLCPAPIAVPEPVPATMGPWLP